MSFLEKSEIYQVIDNLYHNFIGSEGYEYNEWDEIMLKGQATNTDGKVFVDYVRFYMLDNPEDPKYDICNVLNFSTWMQERILK